MRLQEFDLDIQYRRGRNFSTKRHGTGLGLAIVSRIVADHRGYIRVNENKPRGTRFIVELPVKAA